MKGRITTAVSFAMAVAIGAASHAATDVEQLRALHDKVMRAHREGNVDLLLEDEAPDYVVASRGERAVRETQGTLVSHRQRLELQAVSVDMQLHPPGTWWQDEPSDRRDRRCGSRN